MSTGDSKYSDGTNVEFATLPEIELSSAEPRQMFLVRATVKYYDVAILSLPYCNGLTISGLRQPEDRRQSNHFISWSLYYLYYHGRGDTNGNWTTNIATSTDLVNWTKYSQNPLLPVDANKSSGIIVLDGNKLRLYTMHNQVHMHFPRR